MGIFGGKTFLPAKKALGILWQLSEAILDTSWGFSKGGFCEGGNLNNWGGARTGCNSSFGVFCTGLLIESYTNSEIFTGI